MATLTSTHREFGSTSLTVAPTQNTAPVHEFRCLYTRDLHKKAKKWHDGSVRFHTFNRRVMVYDDARNYIGDLHYRQEEEFTEGVEIKLDRGVLVEVGERLGETQTDLAPILDRQRLEKALSPRREPLSIASRPQSTGPSQRPKSLLEVLGPSQGRLGRARIPYQSPYEQRRSTARIEPAAPPRKRQRLSSDKENHSDERQPVRPAKASLPQPKQPSKPVPHSSHRNEPPIEFEDLLDLSSDEEPKRQPPKPARLIAKPGGNDKGAPKKPRPTSGFSPPKPTNLPEPQFREDRPEKNSDSRKKLKPSPISRTSANRTPSTTYRSSATRTARLLLGQPKPRRKVTCILLFSAGPSIAGPLEGSLQPVPRQRSVSRLASPEEEALLLPLDALETNAENPTLRIPISKFQSSTHEQDHVHHGNSSPLFLPEENLEPRPPSPGLLPTQNEFPFSDSDGSEAFEDLENISTSQCPLSARDVQTSPKRQTEPGREAEKEKRAEPQRRTEPALQPPVQNDSWRFKPQLEDDSSSSKQPVLAPGPATGSPARSFRRVFSENDALEDDDFVLVPKSPVFQARTPLQLLDNLSSKRRPAKSKSPTKVQRCTSETFARDTENRLVVKPVDESSKGPTGPWTTEEAFLLFDWWPAEIGKPAYWADTTPESVLRAVPEPGLGFWGGITTARQFLRDDINVL